VHESLTKNYTQFRNLITPVEWLTASDIIIKSKTQMEYVNSILMTICQLTIIPTVVTICYTYY